ncbi:PilZ domain-containing protein [Bdellovibrio sp. 22V]|uniref:PilZ domain-containing protein n=1 Tax=Bdellovibrio TaxID=958 RepID=UPI002543581A|nr:PilZ domain-containing protein [Bdellovibrio sp. 22V]WII73344.1 PilZ domain-containing protein [Bdellovibrio sp. 22V]
MSEALIVFKAIHNEADKQFLLQKILASKETIYLRDKFDRNISLKPVSINSNQQIKCHPPEETSMNTQENATFTASFSIQGEKYIFETHPIVGDNYVTLTVLNLFHLQRRRNYRYVLPKDYSAQFVINCLNQGICSISCRLLDLSTEGCAVEIPQEDANLKLEDLVEAEIFLGDRDPILVQGLLKNIRAQGMTHLVLGIEFNHMANASEGKIVTSLTDLQREIYFRKAG